MNIVFAIVFIALFIPFMNFLTEEFDSINGVFLLCLGILLLALRILSFNESSLIIIPETFFVSGLIAASITLFIGSVILLLKNLRKGLNYNIKYLVFLLVLYIIFGFLQQILFQFIFAESIYYLTKNIVLSVLISAIFYFSVHLRSKRIEFLAGTFLLGILWTGSYLIFGNLIWLGISHGIIGTMYYLNLWDVDVLRKKLRFIDRYL